jgi:hypothetical protein
MGEWAQAAPSSVPGKNHDFDSFQRMPGERQRPKTPNNRVI